MSDQPTFARTPDEVQRAHDQLVAIVLGEIDVGFDADEKRVACANLDVLCWMLGHKHNETFARNMANLAEELAARGIVETKAPRLLTISEAYPKEES